MFRVFFAVLLTLTLGFGAGNTMAQGLLSLGGGTSSAQSADAGPSIAEVMREAAENGVSIVVVDGDGNVLSQMPGVQAPDTEDTDAAAAGDDDMGLLMSVQSEATKFRELVRLRLDAMPVAIAEVIYILRATSPDGRIMTFVEALLYSLALFAVGILFEREVFGKRIAIRWVLPRVRQNPEGYTEKMPFLVFRFVMGVVGIFVSMGVAYILGGLIFGGIDDSAMQFTVAVIYFGYGTARLVSGIWRMVLSPYLAQYRIPNFSDSDAKRLHGWLWLVATLDISSQMFGTWIFELGLNYNVYAFMTSFLALFVSLLYITAVLVNRLAISNAILNGVRPQEVSLAQRLIAQLWAPILLVYIAFAWFELTYDLVLERETSIPLIAGAYAILTSILVVYGVINFGIERYFKRARALQEMAQSHADTEDQEAEDALVPDDADVLAVADHHHPVATYEQLAKRVSGVLALVAGAYACLAIWQPNVSMIEDSLGERTLDVIVIIFIGYIVYHLFRIWIDGKIAEETIDESEAELGDEGGASAASRLGTLLPLFRNFILVVVIVTIALIVMLELGINVGPLFAGAGVVGVAVGFGSQALVRDIFSGAFYLFDDAFRKGEYIDVGGVKGTVEKISVRSFQLRHHLGPLHTIPFGEIQVLTNYSRDWVIMKLPLRVTYDTDVERVRKLIKKLGQDLLEDPLIGDDFLQPLKSQGVIEMQDSAMIIRVKFMTKPGDQWSIRKRVYAEIRALFEREGIKFAHREVTVRLADARADQLDESQKEAIAAATEAALEEDLLPDVGNGIEDDR